MRRLHTFSGLFLLLFFLKYGVSAIPFAHGGLLREYYDSKPQWKLRLERDYDLPVPDNADLREIGSKILGDLGIKGSYGAWREGGNRIAVHTFRFVNTTRAIYFLNDKRLVVEDKYFRWDQFLQKFHWIGGYQQHRFISDLWAFMIDLVCAGIVIWVMTGLYMWWNNKTARFWGTVALFTGFASFALFIFLL